MQSRDKIALHVSKIENLARQLRDVGDRIGHSDNNEDLGKFIRKYNALVTAWDSIELGNQTHDNLRQRLIKEKA